MNDLFFELIRVALGNADRLSHIPKPKEWQMLYDMAKKQNFVGICFAGVKRLVNSENIGKENIAPMDYFQRNDSAIIAHNAKEIEQQIRRIVSSPELISEYSRKAYDCAFKNHNREMMDKRFIETMCKAVK